MGRFIASLQGLSGRARPQRRTSPPPRRAVLRCKGAAADIGLGAGPGWFDSSWDLRCGLEVCEGLPADASLHEWLAVSLRG